MPDFIQNIANEPFAISSTPPPPELKKKFDPCYVIVTLLRHLYVIIEKAIRDILKIRAVLGPLLCFSKLRNDYGILKPLRNDPVIIT